MKLIRSYILKKGIKKHQSIKCLGVSQEWEQKRASDWTGKPGCAIASVASAFVPYPHLLPLFLLDFVLFYAHARQVAIVV